MAVWRAFYAAYIDIYSFGKLEANSRDRVAEMEVRWGWGRGWGWWQCGVGWGEGRGGQSGTPVFAQHPPPLPCLRGPCSTAAAEGLGQPQALPAAVCVLEPRPSAHHPP